MPSTPFGIGMYGDAAAMGNITTDNTGYLDKYIHKYQEQQQLEKQWVMRRELKQYMVRWYHVTGGELSDSFDSDEEAMARANALMHDSGVLEVTVYQRACRWTREWRREEEP